MSACDSSTVHMMVLLTRICAEAYIHCNTSLPFQVYAHAGAVVDGKIYITCGRRGVAYLRETCCFDPAANRWTGCTEGPVERAWHGMAAVNGRMYVIGGSNDERGYRRDVLKVSS